MESWVTLRTSPAMSDGESDAVVNADDRRQPSVGVAGELLAFSRLQALLVFASYLVLSFLFFGRSVTGSSSYYIGHDNAYDPTLFMWFLRWWPYALSHRLNPLTTNLIWAPVGFNVTWATSIPLAGVLFIPLTMMLGVVATYNLLIILAPPLAGIMAYALCRRLSGAFWPAVFGGYLFGFCPYMVSQLQAHAHLVLVFPIPLSVLIVAWLHDGDIGRRSFIVLYALTLAAQFLLSVEIFALMALVTAVALALSFYLGDEDFRGAAIRLTAPIAGGWALAAAIVSPHLYYMLARSAPPIGAIWPAYMFSTDLLNFLIPTPINLIGANRFLGSLSSTFTGNFSERVGYIALPLIAVVIAWSKRHWLRPQCRWLIYLLLALAIATLGPFLQVGGHFVLPLPWLAIERLPLLENALPSRLMVFAFLIVAVVTALWLSESTATLRVKWITVTLAIALTLPNLSSSFWATRVNVPTFFSDGTFARYLAPSDIVLTLPWGNRGTSMLWQAECGMCFKNVAGWTGLSRFAVRRWPIVNYFLGDRDVPDTEVQLKAFLARLGVTAVVIDDADPSASTWNDLVKATGLSSIQIGGISLYKIGPETFSEYRTATGLEMERRADEARFKMLVDAAGRYVAAGHDLREISRAKLIDLGLLPATWTRHPAESDAFVFARDGRVGILEMGSRPALENLIRRYEKTAYIVYFPYPRIVSGKKNVNIIARIVFDLFLPYTDSSDGEAQQYLGVILDVKQLQSESRGMDAEAVPSPISIPANVQARSPN